MDPDSLILEVVMSCALGAENLSVPNWDDSPSPIVIEDAQTFADIKDNNPFFPTKKSHNNPSP